MTPNCPTTTELGFGDRRTAALEKLGATNDVPKPATENARTNKAKEIHFALTGKWVAIEIKSIKIAPDENTEILERRTTECLPSNV